MSNGNKDGFKPGAVYTCGFGWAGVGNGEGKQAQADKRALAKKELAFRIWFSIIPDFNGIV